MKENRRREEMIKMAKKNKMSREEAIAYLDRKGELYEPYTEAEREFTKAEEKEIKKVQKEGKIYGDPMVELNG